MQTYHAETTISEGGTLTIKGLPFPPGQEVAVSVSPLELGDEQTKRYPLRGKPVRYDQPFAGVARDDWDVAALCSPGGN